MVRFGLLMFFWIYSLSANAGTILIKVSNKIFKINTVDEIETLEGLSSNQLIDLLKNADSPTEIEVEQFKKDENIKSKKLSGESLGRIASPGTWTEAKIKNEKLKND